MHCRTSTECATPKQKRAISANPLQRRRFQWQHTIGLGSTKPRAGKEMEAIRAANFLTDNDPHGTEWISTNKVAPKAGDEGRGRAGRVGGRRRRT